MDPRAAVEQPSLVELTKLLAQSPEGAELLRNPFDNPICSLFFNRDVQCIEVVWRKYATSTQLRYIHEIVLCMLVQHSASKILGDHSDLPIIHAEDQRWIVERWLPRATAAGLKATACVVSTTFFGRVAIGVIQTSLARKVKVRNFPGIQTARNWLKTLELD